MVPEADALYESTFVIRANESILADLAGGVERIVRKAPRYVIMLIISLEIFIVYLSKKNYMRMHAWFKVVKVWGVLRHDDHRGWTTASVRMTRTGLRVTLVRTKNS